MIDWILTSGGIAAFSAAALELVRECPVPEAPDQNLPRPMDGSESHAWERMTDADLDALLGEFTPSEPVTVPARTSTPNTPYEWSI